MNTAAAVGRMTEGARSISDVVAMDGSPTSPLRLGGEGQGEVGSGVIASPGQAVVASAPHLTRPLRPLGGEGRGGDAGAILARQSWLRYPHLTHPLRPMGGEGRGANAGATLIGDRSEMRVMTRVGR